MDGGPEGIWISAGKAKRGNSIVTTRSPSFPRPNFAGRRGACVSFGCAPYHVERSMLFVLNRVAGVEELDGARIARAIGFTRFPYSSSTDEKGEVGRRWIAGLYSNVFRGRLMTS
jgi:hypothetical protein